MVISDPIPTPLGQKRHLLRNRRPSAEYLPSESTEPMRMSLIHFRHRFFIRQYVYPCLCILLLIVLVKWHSDKDANRTYGRDYHVNDKVDDMRVVMRPTNNTGIRLEPVRVEPKIEEKVEPKVETKAMVDNDAIAVRKMSFLVNNKLKTLNTKKSLSNTEKVVQGSI